MITKKEILDYCLNSVLKRIEEVELALADADSSLADDTKSSAGDKYETSREMIQQDINRYQSQLAVANKDLDILNKIDHIQTFDHIGLGSLIQTDLGIYFISISIGLIKIGQDNIFVISPISPIGSVLIGKKVGDIISFNNKEQKIVNIS